MVNFNPLKTEAMLFTLRLIESLPNLIFDGTPIKFVTEHKHLGLAFSNNGQLHNHIENILKCASKVIGMMRKLKYTFSRVRWTKYTIHTYCPSSSILVLYGTAAQKETLSLSKNFSMKLPALLQA